MAFRVKDLMIDVLSAQQQQMMCFAGTPICNLHTCALMCTHQLTPCHWGCSQFITNTCTLLHTPIVGPVCEGASLPTPTPTTTPIIRQTPVLQQGDITPLKEQLKAALEAVEKQEVLVNEQLQPKTMEDLNLLEEKLNDALGHIKQQRANLEKKAK